MLLGPYCSVSWRRFARARGGPEQRPVNAQTFEIRGDLSKRIELKRYAYANSGEIVRCWKLIVNIMYNA
jgi:hypothetical protein